MRGLAIDAGSAVLMATHPSLTGITSGSGSSGSTAWHNSVRARMYLQASPTDDKTLRVLEVKKNNYGPVTATVVLRWKDGVYVAIDPQQESLDLSAEHTKADGAFLDLLDRFTREGRNVGASSNAPNYGPASFEKEDCGFNRKQLDAAMRRLFAAQKIRVESYRQSGHDRQRIARL
jgi:RecA-family ATPase